MSEKQDLTVGKAVHHTQGIKPDGQKEYFDFDEDNSPYSEEQMARFIKNNVEDGDRVELVLSPDNEGEFIEINMKSNGGNSSGSNNYSEDDNGSINRQSAVKSVAGMWDKRPEDRKEYKRFKAMVKDAQDFIEQGEFMTGDDNIFVFDDEEDQDPTGEKVQKTDTEERGAANAP